MLRIAVARFELMPFRSILARMYVAAANTADSIAIIHHMTDVSFVRYYSMASL